MLAPNGALPTSFRAQKSGMVMSVTTQIIFPHMSDARTSQCTQGQEAIRCLISIRTVAYSIHLG